ncbi:hypothetical protein ACIQGW_15490 [Lysinibacillus xylanilyticus]|uniref:hypothetical protein n=1 Tax=Lysinibacillus xylanilyticus TaxID=582475 RepID=UPI0038239C14
MGKFPERSDKNLFLGRIKMKRYIKKYTQGFLFMILFPILTGIMDGISNTGELKYWIALAFSLPVYSYFLLDSSKEFDIKNKMFSRVNFIMFIFVLLGMISSLICMVLIGLIK